MIWKGEVELLTNAEFNKIVKTGPHKALDLRAMKEYSLCFGGPRNDHYDVTPHTEADARVMESIIGKRYLSSWRDARSVVIAAAGRLVAFGLCNFMHHIRIGGGNPGPDYPSITNETKGPWTRGGHMCGYVSNSVGGGGDAPNPSCDKEANAHAMKLHNGGRGGQARAACYEAYLLGNKIFGKEELDMLIEEIRKIKGLEGVTAKDVANYIGYGLNAGRPAQIEAIQKDIDNAVKAGITSGDSPGMPITRGQVMAMFGRTAKKTAAGEDAG